MIGDPTYFVAMVIRLRNIENFQKAQNLDISPAFPMIRRIFYTSVK